MNVIRKYVIIITILTSLLVLSACGRRMLFSDAGLKADARLEEIIDAINNEDKEALKAMFSEQALSEAEDLDGRMDYLFEFVDGEITSSEALSNGNIDGSYNNGSKTLKSRSWYYIETEKQKYLIFFLEYTADTEHPENIGIYMLQVIKAEDKATQFDGGQKTLCAGIYKPVE